MKVKIIKTGAIEQHEDGYAARLIEQGKAVPVAKPKPSTPSPTPTEAKAPRKAAAKAEAGKAGAEPEDK